MILISQVSSVLRSLFFYGINNYYLLLTCVIQLSKFSGLKSFFMQHFGYPGSDKFADAKANFVESLAVSISSF
jgi:hypothetical protein